MADGVDSQRRHEILRAAALLFRRHGYERTSVRQIADALSMTSGSLFYHFSAKEDILVAVMEEGIRDVFAHVRGALDREPRMPERLLAMVRSHLSVLLGPHLDALMVLVYEWRSLSAPGMKRVLSWRNSYEDLWDGVLATAAAQGWVHRDVVLVRQTVLGALNWTGQWYRHDSRLDVDTLALRMYEMLFPRLHEQLGDRPVPAAGEGGAVANVGAMRCADAAAADRSFPSMEKA
ncbi:MAG: TetR family transcriptional regulator [Burkholderiaceae bacterium]|nr:TetR family transcriptional regulator [Burkholderiaceae bacterium]